MRHFPKTIAGILALLFASMPPASLADDNKLEQCRQMIDQQLAAHTAQDWKRLAQFGAQYVNICPQSLSTERFASAYENIALADTELNQLRQAVTASDRCLAVSYASIGCHLLRAKALFGLHRNAEANQSLRHGDRLLNALAAQSPAVSTRMLRSPQGELMRSQLDYLDEMRNLSATLHQLDAAD